MMSFDLFEQCEEYYNEDYYLAMILLEEEEKMK